MLLRATLRVLLEAAPADLSVAAITRAIEDLPGVAAVHDLHVWSITSGMNSISGHLRLEHGADQDVVLDLALSMLRERFGIDHATMQCESVTFVERPGLSMI